MPDISMCSDDDCPFSKQCYRHTDSGTKPCYMQSWSLFVKTNKHGYKIKPEDCSGWIAVSGT